MTVKSGTAFVEGDTGGMYTPPKDRPIDPIRAITAHLQPVDQNGFDRPRAKPDPSVTEMVTPPPAPPTMASALARAAELEHADLAQLLDSERFRLAVATISPADSLGLQDVIRDFQPAPAPAAMRPNPAQGSPGAAVPSPRSGSLLERLQHEASKSLTQPEPPGSTYRP